MAAERFPSVHEGKSSERSIMAAVGLVGAVLIGVLAALVARFSAPPNVGFGGTANAGELGGNAAAVLAMVSLVAVGIERFIEMFWSLISSFKNGWWPLPEIAAAVDDLVEEANQVARPAFTAAIAGLEEAKLVVGVTQQEIDRLQDEIAKVQAEERQYKAQIRKISSLAKNNQRVQLVATTAFQAANRLDTAYGAIMPAVRQAFNDASQVTTGLSDILAGFRENPAKKIISIMIGTVVGLVIAGVAGLDLFQAAGLPIGPTNPEAIKAAAFPYIGVMLTGLVVGLGANPTHEIIGYVSEAAKSRRAGNLGRPNVSGSPDERDERAAAAAPPVAGAGAGTAGNPPAAPDDRVVPAVVGRLMGSSGPTPSRAHPGSMNLR